MIGIALLLVAGGIVVTARSSGGGARFAHPDEWDPRVVELVEFVEEARGLRFSHPVYVDFLDEEAYRAEATADEAELTDEERDSLTRDTAVLRALGLAAGEIDLFEAFNTVADSGTLAYYDTDDGRVRVRGTELTVGVRVTVVHELTHALQDQEFDLRRVFDDDLEPSEQDALRGLVEGDAMRIESRYVDEVLDDEERSAYEEEHTAEVEASDEATAEVPGFLTATFSAPYLLGAPFVLMLDNRGGNAAVDDALREPPTSEEHLFDPTSFLADEDERPLELDLGSVEPLDDGTFGPSSWFLVLAERIDPFDAFEAARGWDGDAYAVFEQDDTTCIRAAFAGDTASDETEMADALEAWVDTLTPGSARTLSIDGQPGFEACDPGPDVDIEITDRARDALVLPSLWGYLVAASPASASGDADGARCFARTVLDEVSWDDIVDPTGEYFATDAFQRLMLDSLGACNRR